MAMVGKSVEYGARERTRRPVRTTELAGGTLAAAWGTPRLKMIGPAIQRGAKLADRFGGAGAARAAVLAADTARAALVAGTAPLEQVRRINRVNHLVEVVPRPFRPAVATVAGLVLAAHAIPTTEEKFIAAEEQ